MDIEEDLETVGKFGRAVVAKRVAVIAVVTIVLHLAVANGWITGDLSNGAIATVTSIFDAIGAIVAVATIQPVVTPSKDPRDNTGAPLVPVTDVAVAAPEAEAVEDAPADDEVLDEDPGFVANSPEATDNDPAYQPEHAAK